MPAAERDQVRALPYRAEAPLAAGKHAAILPVKQILRGKQQCRAVTAQARAADEVKRAVRLAPELWVAKICRIDTLRCADDGVVLVFLKRHAVVAPREALCLHAAPVLIAHACVQKIQPLAHDQRAAGEAAALLVHLIRLARHERRRKLCPVQQIAADRVPPARLAPGQTEGVILIENVVFALVPDQSVRVVDPARLAHKMIPLAQRHRVRALLLLPQAREIGLVVQHKAPPYTALWARFAISCCISRLRSTKRALYPHTRMTSC